MVSPAVLLGLAASAALSVIWPVAIFVVCRRRMSLSARNILVGAAVFLVFSLVLERALHAALLTGNPLTAQWLRAHAIGFALYGCLAAGVFEEVGRYLGMRFLVRPSGNPGSAVAYGIGHGGLEAMVVGSLAMVLSLMFALMLNAGRLETTLGPALAPDVLAHLRAGLEQLTLAPLALAAVERLAAIVIQIGLSLVVWRAVERRRLQLLALAIVLHAAIDFPAGLFQAGIISLLAAEGPVLLLGAALAGLFMYRLPPAASASPTRQG
jgi:uncharacterized membrane protein YhfC